MDTTSGRDELNGAAFESARNDQSVDEPGRHFGIGCKRPGPLVRPVDIDTMVSSP